MPRLRPETYARKERKQVVINHIAEARRDFREAKAAKAASMEVLQLLSMTIHISAVDRLLDPETSNRDFSTIYKTYCDVTNAKNIDDTKEKEIHEMNLEEVQEAIRELRKRRHIDATAIEVTPIQVVDIFG